MVGTPPPASSPAEDPLPEPESPTAEIVDWVRAGSQAHFEALCRRILPGLCGWVCLRLPPSLRSRVDPEEVVQDTWLQALLRFADYDPQKGSFRGWMFGIAKNVLLQRMSAAQRHAQRLGNLDTRTIEPDALADTATSATRQVARSDTVLSFLEIVERWGEEDRQLTVLCGLEGLGHREAGLRLGLSEEAAKKRWQRLREKLLGSAAARMILVDEDE